MRWKDALVEHGTNSRTSSILTLLRERAGYVRIVRQVG